MSRKTLMTIVLSVGLACAWVSNVQAQSFPTRTMRWVVPSAPGDGSDLTGRIIADKVGRDLNQPVVIDNKPGAGGVLGSEIVAKAPADGYTMIIGNAGSHGINAAVYRKLNYDVARDFVPVALFCTAPNVMVASPDVPAKTVAEFVAYAKAQAGKLNYASGGVASSSHLSGELLKSLAGIEMTHVPFKGAAPATTAVLGNQVAVMIGNLPPWSAHLKSGRAKALAVTTAKRHHSMPDVPALAETYPGFETVAWFGLLAPAGTPAAVIERMNQVVNAALQQPDVKAKIEATGCDPQPVSPQAYAERVQGDIARWRKLAGERGISLD